MSLLTLFSPAKLNLLLAITGRRADGFHELVSLVAPLAWGDQLTVQPAATITLSCDDPTLPVDGNNLVLKAAAAFRAATGWSGGAHFHLEKRIPVGAGLGGGSSNAAVALRELNRLAGEPLNATELAAVAAGVGSDCALFLNDAPSVIRGRGELVTPLPAAGGARLRGRPVLVFKPAFAISTAWAYRQMVAAPDSYVPLADAERRLATWLEDPDAPIDDVLFNNMERAAFAKFPALPVLLEQLRADFGLVPRMSGSGSACFALLREASPVPAIVAAIRAAWGESGFVVQTRLL